MFPDKLQFPTQQMVHDGSYRLALRAIVDVDSHLPKSHEGSHADSAHDESVRTILMEEIDGALTASLHVGRIVNYGNVPDFSILDVYQRKNVTMAEVT